MNDKRRTGMATTSIRRVNTTIIQRARNVGLKGYLARFFIVAAGLAIILLGIYGIMR